MISVNLIKLNYLLSVQFSISIYLLIIRHFLYQILNIEITCSSSKKINPKSPPTKKCIQIPTKTSPNQLQNHSTKILKLNLSSKKIIQLMANIHPSQQQLYQHTNRSPSTILIKIQKNQATINLMKVSHQITNQNSFTQRPKTVNRKNKSNTF